MRQRNQRVRIAKRLSRPHLNGARSVAMASGRNHVPIVETQLQSENNPVLHAAHHPPKNNMDRVMELTTSVRIKDTFVEALLIRWARVLKSEIIRDICIALIWAILVGLPLFVLHMLVLDYEHYLHGASLQFSFPMSLENIFPYHPISIGLWLIAVFISALFVRRAFLQQRKILTMNGIIERFQNEAYTDELTGIPNRRAFNALIKTRFEFARHTDQPLTIVMVDVDRFKWLNDQYGHIAGDKALRSVAKHLTRLVRAQDVVARYGGDEFVIVCPGLSQEGARALANRLRTASWPLHLETSFGFATYPSEGQSIADIIELADKGLYREKQRHHIKSTLKWKQLAREPGAGFTSFQNS